MIRTPSGGYLYFGDSLRMQHTCLGTQYGHLFTKRYCGGIIYTVYRVDVSRESTDVSAQDLVFFSHARGCKAWKKPAQIGPYFRRNEEPVSLSDSSSNKRRSTKNTSWKTLEIKHITFVRTQCTHCSYALKSLLIMYQVKKLRCAFETTRVPFGFIEFF